MGTKMSGKAILGRLLRSGPLLLDFDGPICSIFAGYPAPQIANELVKLIDTESTAVPLSLRRERDPLEVLRWAGRSRRGAELVRIVEDALCAAELQAVKTADPTPCGREVIVAAHQAGLSVAVVSNNSAGAVRAYLSAHRLAAYVSVVTGRSYADPGSMKPNPKPIVRTAAILGADLSRSVLVGDSLSDIEGARAAGVPAIGFANRDSKEDLFVQAGANVVVKSMCALAVVLMEAREH
jgi:phosphoglycolate phosphatase-like HAD superfamily hydrolase